jgi:hypothetical protein
MARFITRTKNSMKVSGIVENVVDGVECIMLMAIFMKENG